MRCIVFADQRYIAEGLPDGSGKPATRRVRTCSVQPVLQTMQALLLKAPAKQSIVQGKASSGTTVFPYLCHLEK